MFGDDIETRARTLTYDASNPAEVLRDAVTFGLPDKKGIARVGAVVSILAGGRKFAEMNFRSGCEVADVLAARLGMSQPVRDALACTFERWNGKGQPNGVTGERIPLAMRIVHLTHDAEALARLRSPADAITLIRERSGRAYDPGLVAEFLPVAAEFLGRLEKLDPWDAVLARPTAMSRPVLRTTWLRPLSASAASGTAAARHSCSLGHGVDRLAAATTTGTHHRAGPLQAAARGAHRAAPSRSAGHSRPARPRRRTRKPRSWPMSQSSGGPLNDRPSALVRGGGVVPLFTTSSIVVAAPTTTIRLGRSRPGAAGALPPGAVTAAAQAVANDPESRAAQSWRSVSAPNRSLFT